MIGGLYRLKPCPFCGGEAEMIDVNASTYERKRTIYRVECKNGIECPGMPGTRGYDTEREAAAAWNTRAPQEPAEKRNQLRDLFKPTPEQQKRWRESYEKITEKLKKERCCDYCQNAKFEPHLEHGKLAGSDCICGITGELRIFPGDNGKNCEHWELAKEEEK